MKLILVTGGAGFIGSNIAGSLAEGRDWRVIVADQFGQTDKWRNLSKHPIYEVISPGEIFYWLEANRSDLEAIVHMGAVSSTTEKDVDLILETNFSLSRSLWNWGGGERETLHLRLLRRDLRRRLGRLPRRPRRRVPQQAAPAQRLRLEQAALRPFRLDRGRRRRQGAEAMGRPQILQRLRPNEYHKAEQRSVIAQIFPHARHGRPVHLFKSTMRNTRTAASCAISSTSRTASRSSTGC